MQTRIASFCYRAVVVATAFVWPVAVLGAPQDPPSAPVTVVNPPTKPLPVTAPQPLPINGSVTVTGTSNVNVTNANIPVTGNVAASQSGSWNVGITGTPSVTISSPVPVFSAIATKFKTDFILAGAGLSSIMDLGGTINATTIVIRTATNDVNGVAFLLGAEQRLVLFGGAQGDVVVPLPLAVPIDKVRLQCGSGPCQVWVSIVGY